MRRLMLLCSIVLLVGKEVDDVLSIFSSSIEKENPNY